LPSSSARRGDPAFRKGPEPLEPPYPPFIITEKDIGLERLGSWGQRWEDVKITGFIDGETVAVREFSRNPVPSSLSVTSDDAELAAGKRT
jgi:beta-galactosidase